MPFSTAPTTSPYSWEPYLSNDVQNSNNNPPECHQPVKTKWVVDVLRDYDTQDFFVSIQEMYLLSYTNQQYIGLASTGRSQKNDLIP